MRARAARIAALLFLLAAATALAACGGGGAKKAAGVPLAPRPATGAAPWPAPSDPLALTRRAGLTPERREALKYHVHAHLDVYVNGRHIAVPSGIGIEIHDPGVKNEPAPDGSTVYGGIQLCVKPCISPLHTHDDTGVLHTESPTPTPNRLGQFFTEWGVRLSRSCVGGYCSPRARISFVVDGKPFTGDPSSLELADRREIAIVIGRPPARIPNVAGF
jgi:hypothetical protein